MKEYLNSELKQKIAQLPTTPGVYLMKDEAGEVIYVGKAVVLKNRVRQYFTAGVDKMPKVAAMVDNIHTFDTIMTSSELEALILECNLIKQYRPKYNILLRDDKQYPYVRIDLKEDFPKVGVVRRVKNDGAKYFGPYIAAHVVREVVDLITKMYPIRSCNKDIGRMIAKKERPCLNYDMGRCCGPCRGTVSKEEYRALLNEVMDLLQGRYAGLKKQLEADMKRYAEQLDFEKAAVCRDKLVALRRIQEKQKAGFPNLEDKDIFALYREEDQGMVQCFLVRNGKLSFTEKIPMALDKQIDQNPMESFLGQYYLDNPNIPKQIYINEELDEPGLMEQWLSESRGSKVQLGVPKRGTNKNLMDLAYQNAKTELKRLKEKSKKEQDSTVGAAQKLAEVLGIPTPLHRMECYDISNIQGSDTVASMVVFEDGKPQKSQYRRFRIRTVEGPNDFRSMEEVLTRRLLRGFSDGPESGFKNMPDLIVIDGGKGQLSSAVGVLESLGLEDIHIISLAKREEEVFVPGQSQSILLDRGSHELRLLTSLRDEAHRFAITYHRTVREKRVTASVLDGIPGVGAKRKKRLLERFGSVEQIKKASFEEIVAVDGVDIRTAREIIDYFHGEPQVEAKNSGE